MQEHCRNGATAFSARNLTFFHVPCHAAFHQLELSLITCPRALDRIEEVWCSIICCCHCQGHAGSPRGSSAMPCPLWCCWPGKTLVAVPSVQTPAAKEWTSGWVLCRITNGSQIRRCFSHFYAQNSFVQTCICHRYIKKIDDIWVFFCVTCFVTCPCPSGEKKNGREKKQERGRDAPSTKHVGLW